MVQNTGMDRIPNIRYYRKLYLADFIYIDEQIGQIFERLEQIGRMETPEHRAMLTAAYETQLQGFVSQMEAIGAGAAEPGGAARRARRRRVGAGGVAHAGWS